jgi:molybdate transport system substrate-binding protein
MRAVSAQIRKGARFIFALALAFQPVAAEEVSVFAAASLANALEEIGKSYQTQSGNSVIYNFAGSNILARQIQEGAPGDIFFSADEAKMDALDRSGLLAAGSRRNFLSNTLVIVVPTENRTAHFTPRDLAKPEIKRLALADPHAVPAGIYAKEYLEKLGLWQSLESKVVPTENVRAALAAVESGNVDAGIVYKTDAIISKGVRVAFEVSRSEGPKIVYPVALLKNAPNAVAGQTFLDYLKSQDGLKVFAKFGFLPISE